MKILFYLPAVTPWWFETIIAPMLRALHGEAELHVVVAPLWCNTGLEMEHVEPLADLNAINWHIVVPDDPAAFRLDGRAVDGLLDLVHAIEPDITIARSADRVTPRLFPGVVRYITEPGAEPILAPHGWCVLDEQPFHHGVMPAAAAAATDHATRLLTPYWEGLEAVHAGQANDLVRAQMGLPLDRPVLVVPLQYEHHENFYGIGSPFHHGPEFVEELIERLDPRIMLAITDHPLNNHIPLRNLGRITDRHPDRIRLYRYDEVRRSPTSCLIRAADGVLLDQSKCVSHAMFFGTPIVHVGDSVMAPWLNATRLEALDAERFAKRALPRPDRESARRWFGWHYGTRLINPEETTLETLVNRVENRCSDAEVAASITAQEFLLTSSVERAAKIAAMAPPTADFGDRQAA